MFISASVVELWAIPPVRFASHSAAALATGMKVGIGRSGSCSVCSRTSPERFRVGRSAIALSSVCITRTMIVRLDQLRGKRTLGEAAGVADDLGQQLQRPRRPGAVADHQRVEHAHRVAGLAVGDGLDVGVGVGVDAGGDRDPPGQVVGVVLGHGDREDRLAVGPHQLAEPVGDPRQGAAESAALQQLVGPQRAGGDDHAARGQRLHAASANAGRSARCGPRSRRCRRRRRAGGSRSRSGPASTSTPRRSASQR